MTETNDAYDRVFQALDALCEGETDAIAVMATIVCELYHAFDHFDWVGFYRNVGDGVLKIGPYQGGHGCLTIPFGRGVCGKCAREKKTQNVPDVLKIPYHIACSSSTRSEIVVPMLARDAQLIAVLDIDSDTPYAFNETDEKNLPHVNTYLEAAITR